MSYELPESLLNEVFERGNESAQAHEIKPGLFLHHKNMSVADLRREVLEIEKRTKPGPTNQSGVINCDGVDDFSHSFNLYSEARTQVFASIEKREIRAIFDFALGWKQFQSVVRFPLSRQLQAWQRMENGTGQVAFAEFLEDRLSDIVEPSGQDLLQIATDLGATSSGSFRSRANLSNGSFALEFSEDITTTVEVPGEFKLAIPLFERGERYELTARLRFTHREGKLTFKVLLSNLDDSIEEEFGRVVSEAQKAIGETIIRGDFKE